MLIYEVDNDYPYSTTQALKLVDVADPSNPLTLIKNNVTAVHCRLLENTSSEIEVWAVRNASDDPSIQILDNGYSVSQAFDMWLEYRRVKDGYIVESNSYPIADTYATKIEVTEKTVIVGCPTY
jgi:hypothetical protein